jgi:hypothetical protein
MGDRKFAVGDKVTFRTFRHDELPKHKRGTYWKHVVRGQTGVVAEVINSNNYRVEYDGGPVEHDGQKHAADLFTAWELVLADG